MGSDRFCIASTTSYTDELVDFQAKQLFLWYLLLPLSNSLQLLFLLTLIFHLSLPCVVISSLYFFLFCQSFMLSFCFCFVFSSSLLPKQILSACFLSALRYWLMHVMFLIHFVGKTQAARPLENGRSNARRQNVCGMKRRSSIWRIWRKKNWLRKWSSSKKQEG